MASERIEKGKQLVIWPEAADPSRLRFNFIQGSLLHLEICIEVYLCRFDRFVPEPKGDHTTFHACLQKLHRCRVPKHVRSYMLAPQRRTCLAGMCNVLCQQVLHTIGTQASASRTGKDDCVIADFNFTQPGTQDIRGALGQRCRSFLATLAETRTWAPVAKQTLRRHKPVISDRRNPVCAASSINAWSRRPERVLRSGACRSASISSLVRNPICARVQRLFGIPHPLNFSGWVLPEDAYRKNERMAVSRRFRLLALMPRLVCMSSRNA